MRRPRSLAEAVEHRAAHDPNRELVCQAGGESLSAAALLTRAAEVAGGLAIHVRRGDAVATCLDPGVDAVVLTTALSLLGAVEVPFPAQTSTEWLHRLSRDAACRLAIVARCRVEREPRLGRPFGPESVLVTSGLPEVRQKPWSRRHAASDADIACVISTSGTTGRPKGAALRNGAALGQAQRVASAMGYDTHDVLYNFFPWQHINARHAGFLPAVISGARIVLDHRFSASRFWTVAAREGITAFNFMGAVCAILLKQPPSADDRAHRVVRAYGGPAPSWMYHAMRERFGVELLQAYACTELGDVATTMAGEARPGAAGRIVADYDVLVQRDDGSACAPGEVGTLLVRPRRAHLTFSEYVGDPLATRGAWRDGWFHTGDRVRLDDGWLYYAGRSAEVIRRRGHNISAVEVEHHILAMPQVAHVAVVGVRSELTEEELLAIVVPQPQVELAPESVREHCFGALADHSLPRFVSITDALPLTPSLKVRRDLLRERGLPPDAWDAEQRDLSSKGER